MHTAKIGLQSNGRKSFVAGVIAFFRIPSSVTYGSSSFFLPLFSSVLTKESYRSLALGITDKFMIIPLVTFNSYLVAVLTVLMSWRGFIGLPVCIRWSSLLSYCVFPPQVFPSVRDSLLTVALLLGSLAADLALALGFWSWRKLTLSQLTSSRLLLS